MKATKKKIINWNHVSKDLTPEKLKTLADFYRFYHRKWWIFKKDLYFQRADLITRPFAGGLAVIGIVSGIASVNPILLGAVSRPGVLLLTIKGFKNYNEQTQTAKYVFKTCEKILINLCVIWLICAYVRGFPFNEDDLILRFNVIEWFMSDNSPLADRFEKEYEKVFEL